MKDIRFNVPGWTVHVWRPLTRPTWRGLGRGRPGYWRIASPWLMVAWWRR